MPLRWLLAVALLAAVVLAAFASGKFSVAPGELWRAVAARLTGAQSGLPAAVETVVWSIRLPRVAAGLLVGMALAAAGAAYQGMFRNPLVSPETKTRVADLLSASGEVATIDNEGLMDAVTAVSGSGPAYIFHFIEALTAAAEHAGVPSETARLLAMQTVYGAASPAAESREDPGVLRQQVTSPHVGRDTSARILV